MQKELPAQTEWGWKIAAYLFLAGLGGGAYATGAVASFGGPEWRFVSQIGIAMGFPALLVGTLFLIADLGVKKRALGVFLNPSTSWIARGSIFITVFMCLAFVHLVGSVWPWDALSPSVEPLLGAVNLVFAVLVMVYTGVLLGASRSIALWSTAMLPLLFLVSSLSTGDMAILLVSSIVAQGDPSILAEPQALLLQEEVVLLVVEMIVVVFYLQATHRVPESRASAAMILKGRLASTFWWGFVVVGLLVPLVVALHGILAPAGDDPAALLRTGVGVGVPGLVGGFVLRYVVLRAGVRAPLRAGGIEYSFGPVPGGS